MTPWSINAKPRSTGQGLGKLDIRTANQILKENCQDTEKQLKTECSENKKKLLFCY
jgi:hypothetical protein